MKIKKILAVLVFAVLLFVTFPLGTFTASAETFTGTCGDNLYWSLNTNTCVLTITGEGDMHDYGYFTDVATGNSYEYGDSPWYQYRYYIKTVSLPYGLTYIGNDAFYNCYNLVSVNLPNTVTLIRSGAFSNTGLTEINIPESVRFIGHAGSLGSGRGVFQNCTNLKSVTLPESLFSIGMVSFSGCYSLVDISLPKSLNMICSSAFYDCYSLESVYYCGTEEEWSTISIDYGNEYLTNAQRYNHKFGGWITDANGKIYRTCLFCGEEEVSAEGTNHDFVNGVCSVCKVISAEMLTYTLSNNKVTITDCDTSVSGDVIIPSTVGGYSVKAIGSDSFFGCSKITGITIPDSVTSISDDAFYYCSNLKNIIVDSNNTNYCSVDGVLFDKNKTAILCCPGGKSGEYTILDNVTSIGNYAFGECRKITKIYIPDTVSKIGNSAFNYCQSLTSINIPAAVTSIGYGTFNECRSLPSIVIPNTVKSIGDYAFSYCRSFTSITIPNSVTSIGNYAFSSCHYLLSAIIPNSVTKIGDGVFNYCDVFKNIYYCGTEEQWNKISIGYSNTKITNATKNYHNFSDWVISKDATCSSSGEEYRTCSLCGEVETQTISMKSHTYTSVLTAPTCTEKGYTTYTCDCGDSYVTDEVSAIGHSFVDWIVRTNATCKTDGEQYRVCIECGVEEIAFIISSGHNYKSVNTEKTCTEYGYTVYTCENCSDTYTVIDSENGYAEHKYHYEWTIKATATCIADGENFKTCTECGHTITQTIAALGHDYADEFTIDKIATDFEVGSKSKHCSRCDSVTEVTIIPKTSLMDGICGEDAKWAVREDGTLILAGNGATDNYKLPSYAPWSNYANIITQIIIPETISKIGNNNFGNFTALSKVVIENPHCSFGLWVFPENTSNFAFYCMGGASVEEYTKNNNIILIKPECPNIPIAPILKYRTETSVELEKIEGYEYSIDGVKWQTDNIFNNLSSGKSYTFYQRIAENIYAPSYNSESLIVTTLSKTQPPIIVSVVKNTVTLQYENGYEYSVDGVNWQISNIFTKVSYDTLICFYQRKAASETDGATSASEPTKCIIASAPKVLVGQNSIKVVAKPNYEYCIDDMVWQDSNVFTKYIIPNETYTVYQRPKAQDGVEIFYDTNGVSVCVNGEDIIKNPNSTHLVWLRKMLLLNDNCYSIAADFNNDGVVNIIDLVRLKKTLASQLTVVYDRQYSVYVPNTDNSNEIDLYLCTINFTSNGLCEFGQGEYSLTKTEEAFETITYNGQEYSLIGGTGGDCEFTVTNEEIIVSDEWKEMRLAYDTNNNLVITYISGDFENWFGFKVGTVLN